MLLHLALGNELCEPRATRRVIDPENRLKDFGTFGFFDLTKVDSAIVRRGLECIHADSFPSNLAFLPIQTTWMEFQFEGHESRQGVILQQPAEGVVLLWPVFYAVEYGFEVLPEVLVPFPPADSRFRSPEAGGLTFNYHASNRVMNSANQTRIRGYEALIAVLSKRVLGSLVFINTPRPGGRIQFPPHVGLQRKLARMYGVVGKYPLKGREEIRLSLRPTEVEAIESDVSGAKRAWHRVRAHLWMGRRIEEYWRGNPEIGLKRNHYLLRA
jgi:hypothetical protein